MARGAASRRLDSHKTMQDHVFRARGVDDEMVDGLEFGLAVCYGRVIYRDGGLGGKLYAVVDIDENELVRWLLKDAHASLEKGTVFHILKKLPHVSAEDGARIGFHRSSEPVPAGECGIAWLHNPQMIEFVEVCGSGIVRVGRYTAGDVTND